MAEDGFPLAKLPQVEKLPIVKLWLEMRIGRYWTYTDKVKSVTQSKTWWKHTDVCYTQSKPTRMPYTNAKATTMTWRSAKQIRKVAAQKTDEFYRLTLSSFVLMSLVNYGFLGMLSNRLWKLAGNFLPPLLPTNFPRILGETVLSLIYQLRKTTCFLIKLCNPMTFAISLTTKKLFAFVNSEFTKKLNKRVCLFFLIIYNQVYELHVYMSNYFSSSLKCHCQMSVRFSNVFLDFLQILP